MDLTIFAKFIWFVCSSVSEK